MPLQIPKKLILKYLCIKVNLMCYINFTLETISTRLRQHILRWKSVKIRHDSCENWQKQTRRTNGVEQAQPQNPNLVRRQCLRFALYLSSQATQSVNRSDGRGKKKQQPTKADAPDGVVRPQADPVRNWPVLPHLLRQLLLDPERLVRRLKTRN